jgi:O-antigen/teichoic acid export membrane protein
MPFIVHRLGDHNYGYWALVASVLGYYGVLDLGIVTAVQYQVAKSMGDQDPDAINRTVSTSVYALALLGAVICGLTALIASLSRFFIANSSDIPTFRAVLLIMGASFAIGFPARAFMGTIQAHLRFDLGASISVLVLLLRTILIVTIIGTGRGVVALALISLLSDAVGYVLTYFALKNIHAGLRVSAALASWHTFKGLFNYSGYALVIQISDQLRYSVDAWMVGVFVGVNAVTHYAVASRLSQSFLALIIAAVGILSPWFSQLIGKSDTEGIRRVFTVGTKVSASVSTIVGLSLVLYGYVFIQSWMGKGYIDAYWPLALLVAAIYCDVAQLPSVSYMFGVSRHKFLAWTTLVEGVGNFGLSIFWARQYGMVGVAMGTFVPMAIAKLFVQPWYVCKHLEIPLGTYYFKLLGRSVVPPALAAVLLWACLLRRFNLQSIWSVCLVIAGQAIIGALVTAYFTFEKEERSRVFGKLFSKQQVSVQADAV